MKNKKPKLQIQIDDREIGMKEIADTLDLNIEFIKTRLSEGDYVFQDIGIERKTIDDFCSSILDGRIDSQIPRMKEKYNKVIVIVVGNIKDRKVDIHENCVLGMLSKLVVNFDVNVLFVDDEFQFLYLIKRIAERKNENDSI